MWKIYLYCTLTTFCALFSLLASSLLSPDRRYSYLLLGMLDDFPPSESKIPPRSILYTLWVKYPKLNISCRYVCVYAYIYIHAYICAYTCVCIIYIYISVYLCVYVCVCVWVYTSVSSTQTHDLSYGALLHFEESSIITLQK